MSKISIFPEATIFVPFVLTGKVLIRSHLFPICKTVKEARVEVFKNPLAQYHYLQYQEMTRAELTELDKAIPSLPGLPHRP